MPVLAPDQQRQYDDFIKRNPGDQHRAASALGFDVPASSTSSGPFPSLREVADQPVSTARQERDGSSSSKYPNLPVRDTGIEGISAVPGVDDMINRDQGSWYGTLAEAARAYGFQEIDALDALDSVIRNVSYAQNAGRDPAEFIRQQIDTFAKRAAPTRHRRQDSQTGPYPTNADPRTEPGYNPAYGPQVDLRALFPSLYSGTSTSTVAPPSPSSAPVAPTRVPGPPQMVPPDPQVANVPVTVRDVFDWLNPGYQPPAGAVQNDVGYWELPDGNLAPGQTTPGSEGWTPVDATGQLLPHVAEHLRQWKRSASPAPSPTPEPASAPVPPPSTALPQPGVPTPTYGGGAFDDPASNFAEQSALARREQRLNPPAESGTARYEAFAKEFAQMLQGDVFSDTEEAAMRARAFGELDQMRQREIEAKKVELAQRRISDKSGVFISEMNRIDDKYDQLRSERENELLVMGIGERQRRLTQSFSVLGSLMASEEGRYDAALALSMIPLQLQDQSFQRLIQATGMGGDLSGVTNSLMALLDRATNNRLYNEAQQMEAWRMFGQFVGQYQL